MAHDQIPNRSDGDTDEGEISMHQVVDLSEAGANLELQPFSFVLSFSNLTYSIKVGRKLNFLPLHAAARKRLSRATTTTSEPETALFPKTKAILNQISGQAYEGEILALLGASGSGKTTLIDALANRIAKTSLKGTVTLNGEAIKSSLSKQITAYVKQDDLLFPMLTVEETLMFAAEFRLPRKLSKSKKKLRVEALIDQLGLRNAAKTVIGDEGHRGVSGGERRRVSIGIEIIHDPILLFLDEPTSGLDSTSAFMVVKVLQTIAQSGSIVIMSVHQPSYRILNLIDRLILLSRGQMVYRGPTKLMSQFFADYGHPIPENANQIEFALDLICELESSSDGIKRLSDFNKIWDVKEENADQLQFLSFKEAISLAISRGKLISGASNINSGNPATSIPSFANPFWVETLVLLKRSNINSQRMPEMFIIRFVTLLLTGFLLATVYWKLDDTPKGVRERLGFFAFAVSTTYFSSGHSLPTLIEERKIFTRETAYNTYRHSSYVLSHTLGVLPSLICLSLAFSLTTFWAVLGSDGGLSGFVFYFLMIFGSFWSGNSLVTFIAGVIPNMLLSYTVLVPILAYFLLFSGFFITRDRIPPYWIWFHYMSLIKYPYEGIMQNEFDNPEKCFMRAVNMFDNTPFGVLPTTMKENLLQNLSAIAGVKVTNSTCLRTGLDILKQQGVTDLNKWYCLWVILAWGFFFRILFYFSLLLGSKNKRK